MLRNIALGHFYNEPFIEACRPWTGRIREVFLAWPGVLSCRPAPEFTDEVRNRLFSDLLWCRENGILLDTLFNCNCYGDDAISPELADFCIADPAVSRVHAKISYRDGRYYLRDLGSRNGTYIGEHLLVGDEERQVAVGDLIRFAECRYRTEVS
jgi:hypothetical protein